MASKHESESASPANQQAGVGAARINTLVAALLDTNILVYVFEANYPRNQGIAAKLLQRGLAEDSLCLPHQAIVESVASPTRPRAIGPPILSLDQACREAEEMLDLFPVLYPNEDILRTAARGVNPFL